MFNGAKVVVDEVVAPAVQLVSGLRRAVGKMKEGAVERMAAGELVERPGARKDRPHFLFERHGVQPSDVVIAVVGKEKTAELDVLPQPFAFLAR